MTSGPAAAAVATATSVALAVATAGAVELAPPLLRDTARAFGLAVTAGRTAQEAGVMPARDMGRASTPVFGMAELLA